MKTLKQITLALLTLLANSAGAQTINWASLKEDQRNIINVNAGYDFAFTYGVAYGYQLKSKLPIVLGLDHSHSAGEKILDDFKTKLGGQIRLYQINNFQFSARVQGLFRRYENSSVRLLNFGSDMAATAGYYRPRWFAAGEFGFDKAVVTHFKHSGLFRENFSSAKDGWYVPATGGNFYYGIQTGFSAGSNDLSIRLGKVVQQDFETTPMMPYYFQLAYNKRF